VLVQCSAVFCSDQFLCFGDLFCVFFSSFQLLCVWLPVPVRIIGYFNRFLVNYSEVSRQKMHNSFVVW